MVNGSTLERGRRLRHHSRQLALQVRIIPSTLFPNDDSDDHSDILINYEFSINVPSGDGTTKEFKAKGEIPIVVDAVADPGQNGSYRKWQSLGF